MSAFTYSQDGAPFSITFKRCSREPLSWKEELYTAARNIAKRSNKPLWLCSSGGIDSEIMCHAFFDQGINFSVLTLSQTGGTNEHDISYARNWCRTNGVFQKIVPFDMHSFIEGGIERLIQQGFVAGHPFRYMQLKMFEIVESLGGYAVLGGGEQLYLVDTTKPKLAPEDVFLEYHSGFLAPLKWNEERGMLHEPYFFYSSPEACLAYLNIPLIQTSLENPDMLRHKASTYLLKRLVYQSVWHSHQSRPKFDGFENVRLEVKESSRKLVERFGAAMQYYRLPISQLRADLTPVR